MSTSGNPLADDTVASLKQRLQRVTDELEASQEEAYQFARVLSHDLAAPLTSTRWLLETLRDQPPDAVKPLIDNAIKNLEQMAGIIEAITSHAKVALKSVHGDSASMNRAMERAIANLGSMVQESGAQLEFGDLPEVAVESAAVTSLLQNLLSNAIKFRKPGTAPMIAVTAELQDTNWIFRVTDNGIGIAVSQFVRIFQPLQRLNPGIPGRGIGLTTCKKIVERTGGRIWVESVVGEGSTFLFTLPAQAADLG